MILINIKFPISPDKSAEWLELADSYAKAVRAEPGNRFFEFSCSLDDPNTYVCIEGFVDAEAGAEHMQQSHVQQFMNAAPDFVSARPQIIYVDAEEIAGFVEMGEISPR